MAAPLSFLAFAPSFVPHSGAKAKKSNRCRVRLACWSLRASAEFILFASGR
jgi:hypothetical protein